MGNIACCFDEKKSQYYSVGPNSSQAGNQGNNSDDLEEIRFSSKSPSIMKESNQKLPPLGMEANMMSHLKDNHQTADNEAGQMLSTDVDVKEAEPLNEAQLKEQQMQLAASPPSLVTDIKPITVEVDDHLEQYMLPEGTQEDQEFEVLAKLKNENEKELLMNKRGLKDFIEKLLTEDVRQTEDKKNLWDLKLNKDDIKVYVKKTGGSPYNQTHPYVKSEMILNENYEMRKIIEAIFNPDHRAKWDKNILKLEDTALSQSNNFIVKHQINRGVLNMNNRQFLDKMIKFVDDKTFYVYYSDIQEGSEHEKEKPAKTDRAQTILGAQKMYRRPEDGKIVYEMLMQCDLKMNITPKLIAMFLPNGMQDWMQKLNKYIQTNYDKI